MAKEPKTTGAIFEYFSARNVAAGAAKSAAKAISSRENGKKGGRPKKNTQGA